MLKNNSGVNEENLKIKIPYYDQVFPIPLVFGGKKTNR